MSTQSLTSKEFLHFGARTSKKEKDFEYKYKNQEEKALPMELPIHSFQCWEYIPKTPQREKKHELGVKAAFFKTEAPDK